MSDNIEVLLNKIDEGVATVRSHYEADLAAKELSGDTLYAVMHVVGDAQSALDWTATTVKSKLYPGSDWDPYYPIGKDQPRFEQAIDTQIKTIRQDHPAVAAAFERHQPYQLDKLELGYLKPLRKINTHRDFTPQTRTEQRRVDVQFDGGSVSFDPAAVTFGSGVDIGGVPVNPATQRPVPHPSQTVTETIYVDWRFNDPDVSVLPTLEALARLVREAVVDIRREAQL